MQYMEIILVPAKNPPLFSINADINCHSCSQKAKQHETYEKQKQVGHAREAQTQDECYWTNISLGPVTHPETLLLRGTRHVTARMGNPTSLAATKDFMQVLAEISVTPCMGLLQEVSFTNTIVSCVWMSKLRTEKQKGAFLQPSLT